MGLSLMGKLCKAAFWLIFAATMLPFGSSTAAPQPQAAALQGQQHEDRPKKNTFHALWCRALFAAESIPSSD
jgi:hypothetical protein